MCMGIGMPSELGVVEGPQLCTDGSMGRNFKWPRCAVCWKGELLASKGAMAERLDVLMKRS